MESLKTLISNNIEYFTLGGIIITLVGVVVAFYFYYKSKRVRKAVYQKTSFNLINESINQLQGLAVNFKGNHVNNLTITKVAIWNAGNQTINNTDIVVLDPLRIIPLEGIEIYDIEIIGVVEKANNFNLIQKGNGFGINFDYFDPKEGCAIKIYHSGKMSKNIKILGKIKGQGDVCLNNQLVNSASVIRMRSEKSPLLFRAILQTTLKTGWIIYLIASIISLYIAFHESKYSILLITAFCLFGVYVMYPHNYLPNRLSKIFSDEN